MVKFDCIRCGLIFDTRKKIPKDLICDICKYSLSFQAYCHWCSDPIYEPNTMKVKFFWNRTNTGYPICNWCYDGLKTDGKISEVELRKRCGLPPEPIEKQKLMDKWI